MSSDEPVCLVPARGTEPRLPKKNFKRIAGKPLVAHTIETALECQSFDEVYLSTDDDRLAAIATEYGATVPFRRPSDLADETTQLPEVIDHAVTELRDGGRQIGDETPIVVLQPDVPFLLSRDVESALDTFRRGADSVISVVEERGFFWQHSDRGLEQRFDERVRTDELEPFYRETGSINVTTPRLVGNGVRVSERPGYVVTNRLAAHSVDSVLDIWMAEQIAAGPAVVFRVDGGGDIGMGHVSRCLTLASELSDAMRCSVTFVSDPAYEAGIELIRDAGYDVVTVGDEPSETIRSLDPDIVFFDVLDTDPELAEPLHDAAAALINLEDLAGGLSEADLVINALYATDSVDPNHHAGAEYFVLREEFVNQTTDTTAPARHVLCTFGGSDPSNLSATAVRALAESESDLEWRLILGPDYGGVDELASLPTAARDAIDIRTEADMSAQMEWADLAVSSGGRTVYELAATGTPTIAIAQNDRERERLRALSEKGVVEYLGLAASVAPGDVAEAVEQVANDQSRRTRLSDRGQRLVDGEGTQRILDLVSELVFG